MNSIQGKPLLSSVQLPGFSGLRLSAARARTADKAAEQKKKNQRKAARKARNRNR